MLGLRHWLDEFSLEEGGRARETQERVWHEASRSSVGYRGVWSIPTTFLQFDFFKFQRV